MDQMLRPWERARSGNFLRKASKDLMPSESPFFSLKALSSSPWCAKPFMRTPYAHRAFGVARNAYSSALNELKKNYNHEDDSEAILRHWRTALRTSPHAAKLQSRSNPYVVQVAFTIGSQTSYLGLWILNLRKHCTFRSLQIH